MSTGTFPPVSLTCKHQKIMYISNCMSSVQKTTSPQLLSSISKLQISLNGFRVKILDLNCSNLSTTEHCINEDS